MEIMAQVVLKHWIYIDVRKKNILVINIHFIIVEVDHNLGVEDLVYKELNKVKMQIGV